jgi:DNA polymerase III subunit gamma/tau
MSQQATAFGQAELSRAADVVNVALTEMTGATSPRLHLELMVARILVPASDESDRGALARVERLERRIGVDDVQEPSKAPAAGPPSPPATQKAPLPEPVTPVSLQQIKDSWPEILRVVEKEKRTAWMVVYASRVVDLSGDVLTLSFASENDVANFKQPQGSGDGVSEYLRTAIVNVLGLRVKFVARVDAQVAELADDEAVEPAETGWKVTAIPESAPVASKRSAAPVPTTPSDGRYGEAVVRELLGASFIEEQKIAPTVIPVPKGD